MPYAVALVDLDRFKALNDTFGHETGDRALRLFARTLQRTVRGQDVVSRYGGEEFVVLFPHCTALEAAEIVGRVREALAGAVAGGGVPPFTASFGLADADPDADFEAVLREADGCLLTAKREGRDRLVVAEPEGAAA